MDQIVDYIRTWRVAFLYKGAPVDYEDGSSVIVLRDLAETVAVSRPIALADAIGDGDNRRPEGALDIIWAPPSAGSTQDLEKRLETVGAEGRPPIRASLRSTRVVWTDSCVLIAVAPDQLEASLDAVVRFTLAERSMIKLEREMTALWPEIDMAKTLTHSVGRRQLAQRRKLDTLTERATDLSVEFMRLEGAIEQLDPRISAGSKRLYAELVLQAAIHDRLETLADPVDYADEIFERANSRLSEAGHARTGFYLETLIIVALAAEILAVIFAKF
jgi:hypothetical protein